MKRTGSAVWRGDIKGGKGEISTQSGTLNNTQYSFATRFENGIGTNPEELIAAAHAGCFAMAFSLILGNAGFTPESIDAKATVSLEKQDAGFAITTSHLEVTSRIPGIDEATYQKLAGEAEKNCPVSKVLNARISMDAKLG
jgi:lipoyl-dependent peroxiredoxin